MDNTNMVTVIANKEKKEKYDNAPFTMVIELNGITTTFNTYPSSWLMDMDSIDDDFTMSEEEFIEALEKEWEISTLSGAFNMIYEGNLLGDLLDFISVEVRKR